MSIYIQFFIIGKGASKGSTSSSVGNANIPQRIEAPSDSPLWKYVDILETLPGGGAFRWRCRGCDVERKSSYFRVVGHLCGYSGRGVKKCPGKNNTPVPNSVVLKYIEEHEQAEEREERRQNAIDGNKNKKRTKGMKSTPDVVIEDHPFYTTSVAPNSQNETPIRHKRKGPLENAFQNQSREIADIDAARCLFANGLSFNLVRSPYFKQMLRSANKAPAGYSGPSFERVRTTLLDDEVKLIDEQLKPIKDSWIETGVTIVSDGWKDAKNRPLINVLAVSPKGAMFLKAIDCEGKVKDGPFIANILIEAIEQVGARNVVQVITDNAKNCRAAGLLVEERYQHIFWTPCAVHSFNLMLQKIGKSIQWIKEIYAEAEDIQMFITNHHMTQGIFRMFSRLELLKVSKLELKTQVS